MEAWRALTETLKSSEEEVILQFGEGEYFFNAAVQVVSNITVRGVEANGEKKTSLTFIHSGSGIVTGLKKQSDGGDVNDTLTNVLFQDIQIQYGIGQDGFVPALTYAEADPAKDYSLITLLRPYDHKYNAYSGLSNISFTNVHVNANERGHVALNLGGVKNLTVRDCRVEGSGYGNGIGVEYSEKVLIENNTVHNTGRAGIQLYRGNKDVTVKGNHVSNWMQRYGVYHYLYVMKEEKVTNMFDAGIDSYGPHNDTIHILDNMVRVGESHLDENPCNRKADEMLKKWGVDKPLLNGQVHAYYQPYRLSGAKNVLLENNKAIIKSVHAFGFLFVAERAFSNVRGGTEIGTPSNIVVRNNEMEISGESRFPLRLVSIAKENGVGVEFYDNTFTMEGPINHGGIVGKPDPASKPAFATVRLADSEPESIDLVKPSEELVLINNRIIHKPIPETDVVWARVEVTATTATMETGMGAYKRIKPVLNRLITVGNKAERNKEVADLNSKTGNIQDFAFNLLTAPIYDDILAKSEYQGNLEAPVAKVVLSRDGVDVKEAMMQSDTFQFTGMNTLTALKDSNYVIKGFDAKGYNLQTLPLQLLSVFHRLSVGDYMLGATSLSGKYGENIAYVRIWKDGKAIGQAATNNGIFTFSAMLNYKLNVADNVEIVGVDKNYKELNRVALGIYSYELSVDVYLVGTASLTGKVGKGMGKIQLTMAGKVVKEVAPKGDGTFEFTNVADLLVAGSDVRVSGLDKDNIIQKSVIVPVRDYRLSVEPYQIGQNELVGTCGQDIVSVDFQTLDGMWLSAVINPTTRRFHFAGMAEYAFNETIHLEARNSDGDICHTMVVNVKDYTLMVSAYEMGKVQLDGIAGKDIVKVQLMNGNGTPKMVDVRNRAFQFTIMLLQDIQPTSDVMIQGLDSFGKVQNQVTLTILDYTVTAPFLEVGQDVYRGTYGKDVFKVRFIINGTVVQATTENGIYTFTGLKKFNIQTKDTVDVIAVQQEKHIERYRVPVAVYDFSLAGPVYSLDQTVYSGNYGEHIYTVALLVNRVQKAVATKANGVYTFSNMASWIKNSEDTVEIVGIDAQGVVRKTYPLSIKDERLLISDYVLGEGTYQGSFGGAIAKVRLWVNGKVEQQAQTSQGIFTFTNMDELIKHDQVLAEVVGVTSNYVELARRVVTILDYRLTLTTSTYILGSPNYLTGSRGKDIAKIFLFINGEKTTRNAGYTDAGFQIYLPLHVKSVSSPTQKYELVGFDKDDQIRSRQEFTVIPR
ncbi:right-handed parallel beta-helix repeat-containing protein [Listeria weihenstephanensis]|uniref:Right-handed parallel beta-helix repeat-containing protein n=1 Tax=Listeria weihenstephanensis TaxID=1006155 RepID=A0A841Z6E3_9LIST|nr:right-handed parallel beta-helix repeat-containing protein [Listeria weihenstephanensis]MBC1500788.1 right-handed parallel beta-helix repeat-containing protein [Listeria weihenstephanensis]